MFWFVTLTGLIGLFGWGWHERDRRRQAERERDLAQQQRDGAQAAHDRLLRLVRRPWLSEREAVAEAQRVLRGGWQ